MDYKFGQLKMSDIIMPSLADLIKLIFLSVLFPGSLQIAKVTVIFQGGDKNSVSSYRSTSIQARLFEGYSKIDMQQNDQFFFSLHRIVTPLIFCFTKTLSVETYKLELRFLDV